MGGVGHNRPPSFRKQRPPGLARTNAADRQPRAPAREAAQEQPLCAAL